MVAQQKIVLAIFATLLILCGVLIVSAEFLGPTVRGSLLPVASEGFKVVLGAMVGALSAILGAGRT
jgi:hypothetical protein